MNKTTRDEEASWHGTVRAAANKCNVKHERGGRGHADAVVPLKDDVIPFYRKVPWLCYLDWHIRFWVYFDSIPHGVAWYASVGFYIGSYFFIVGSFAAIAPVIIASETIEDCGKSAYDILVNHLFLIGTTIWFPACYCQMCDAANHGYEVLYEEWVYSGRIGKKPRYKWLAWEPSSLEYWGAFLYTLGIVAFLIATSSAEITSCPRHVESDDVLDWTDYYMFMAGGICFFTAGVLYIFAWESTWIIAGILPISLLDMKSFRWWGLFFYFWGGVGYMMSGIFLYWLAPSHYTLSTLAYQIEFGIGYGGGTVCYFLGAIFLLCHLSRGRCRKSFRMIHNRLEPTHGPSRQFEPTADMPGGLPMRYSMDKTLIDPLPTFKSYSVEQAQKLLQRESARQQETGEQRFSHPPVTRAAEQDPDPSYHLGRLRIVRTSYQPFTASPTDLDSESSTRPLSTVKEDASIANGKENAPAVSNGNRQSPPV